MWWKKTFLLLLITYLNLISLCAQTYLSSKAKKGDGILLLLGRYNLERNSCNLQQFCKLNKLKNNAYLVEGKTYKLPILIKKFNGKSIRSSLGLDDWKLAKQVELYNDAMLQFRLKAENFRSGHHHLWVPYHITTCPYNKEQYIPRGRTFPIFGKNHELVPLEDKRLAGAVYYIVAGHGGPDPGAMGRYERQSICEDEYAYDISLRLARGLVSRGALVYLITRDKNDGIRDAVYLPCDEDEYCWGNKTIPLNQKERLSQRSDIINQLYLENEQKGIEYQRLVEIHVDSRSQSERVDLFFYHFPGSQLGKMLATRLHQTIKNKYAIHRKDGTYQGTVTGRDLHMLREVKPLGAFIEVANIQNKFDQKRILLASNRQALADWLMEGLVKDY